VDQVTGSARLLRFGIYEIDLEAGELRKGGRKVSLQEQPFQVLVLLLTNHGRLVAREELQRRLWPADTFVDFDLGLNTAIKKIRTALGDSAENPRFIETLPRRGYRFICPVEEISSALNQAQPAIPTLGQTAPAASAARVSYKKLLLALGLAGVLMAGGIVSLHRTGAPRTRAELERLGDRGTADNTAYEFYKKGRMALPGNADEAIQQFQQALKADPLYTVARGGLGEAYMKKYKTTHQDEWKTKAQDACKQAVDLDFTRPAGRICLGIYDHVLGNYKQAVQDFSEAIKIDPENKRAYQLRAWAYQLSDQPAKAESDFLKVTHLPPADFTAYADLGQFYFKNSQFAESARAYESAIGRKGDDARLHSSLAAAYEQMGKYDQEIAEIQEANRLQPNFDGFENLGLHLLNKRNFDEAIQNFQAAIQQSPEDYRGYGTLARAYFWAGKRDLARANYEHAIALAKKKLEVNPDDADVNLMLAVYQAMLGQEKPALYHLASVQQLQPDVPEVAFWAAIVELTLGKRDRALALVRQAHDLGYPAVEMNAAPDLDSLRNDPEFRQIMSAANTVHSHHQL